MIFGLKRLLPLFFLLPIVAGLSPADDYQINLREAIRLYRADLLNDAESAFRRLHKDYRDSLSVLYYLGKINIRQEQWGEAKDWFNEIIDLKEDEIEARYYLGNSYRETGKYKAFLLQTRDWRRAERHYKYVLDHVGPYKDIFYQYALLKKYWKDYAQSVDLAEQQLKHKPDSKAYAGVHRFYESFLFNNPKEFQSWATARTGDRNFLYLGESYRHEKKLAKSDSIFHHLLKSDLFDIRIPLYIAFAKTKYQMGQEDSCQYYYEKAVESIQSQVDAELLFQDVKYIFSDAEWFQYRDLNRVEDKRAFFTKLWIGRNPMPASQINYRIREHVRRTIAAEKDFYFDGVRSQVNNPDKLNYLLFPQVFRLNDKFNDKGLVYIRHGEPDDRGFYVQIDVPMNETWVYYARGQLSKKLMFHFWQDDTQAGNNWRFIPSIPQYMAESRLNMDPIFSRLYTANYLEALAIDHEMKLQSQELVKIGMDTDQHSWKKELRSIFFPFYLATFREGPDKSRCELYYSLDTEDVLTEKTPHTAQDSVNINFAVFDMSFNTIQKIHKNVLMQHIIDSTETLGFWPSQFDFVGAAGDYQLALDIRTPNDEAIGGYKFRFTVSSYSDENIKMSGLILAKSIQPAEKQDMFYRNSLRVVPNPGKEFSRKQPIHVYFEIYNMDAGTNKRQSFTLRYNVRLLEERTKGLIRKIGRIFQRSQPSISNEVERETTKPTSVEYIALDLGKNVPGIYELRVTTLVSGTQDSVSRKINFELK